jgi:hypothetical protein
MRGASAMPTNTFMTIVMDSLGLVFMNLLISHEHFSTKYCRTPK